MAERLKWRGSEAGATAAERMVVAEGAVKGDGLLSSVKKCTELDEKECLNEV